MPKSLTYACGRKTNPAAAHGARPTPCALQNDDSPASIVGSAFRNAVTNFCDAPGFDWYAASASAM